MARKRKVAPIEPAKPVQLNMVDEPDEDDDEDEYPSEFRLFVMGENVAYKVGEGYSVCRYDNVCGAKVMAFYRERGLDMLPIDHEHQTFNAPANGQTAPAHGWFIPEHREDDGLYATQVKLTESGKELLAKGPNGEPSQYRFYSPACEVDEHGLVARLHNAAFTNLPALSRLRPLVAATAAGDPIMDPKLIEELKAQNDKLTTFHDGVLSALGVKTVEEASGALAGLLAARGQVDELQKRLSALETEGKKREQADVTAVIDAAVVEGRLPPAKREEVMGLYSAYGRTAVEKCLSMLTVIPSQEPIKQADASAGLSLLSAAEKKVAKTLGLDEKAFAETRDKVHAKRNRKDEDGSA